MTRPARKNIVLSEELDDAVRRMMDLADETALKLRRTPGHTVTTHPKFSVEQDDSFLKLRAALEDEVIAAIPTNGAGTIAEIEITHEVSKRALIGLKLSRLKELAKDLRVSSRGNSEDVATQIAQAYSWDERGIAELVIANEQEPSPERGTTDRLFPLRVSADLAYTYDRLRTVTNRYVRVNVAKWFVFDEVQKKSGQVDVKGTYQSYDVRVDNQGDEARLIPDAFRKPVSLEIHESDVLHVRTTSATAARAAARATEVAANLETRGYVVDGTVYGQMDAGTLFLLDILDTRLLAGGFSEVNITIARFRTSESSGQSLEDTGFRHPNLRAVRFEGDHILDSVQACRLISKERRALTDIAFQVRVTDSDIAKSGRFPVRLALEGDHVQVSTGFGTNPELSVVAHRRIVDVVEAEINDGSKDPARLELLLTRIRMRAEDDATPTLPTILNGDID